MYVTVEMKYSNLSVGVYETVEMKYKNLSVGCWQRVGERASERASGVGT